MLRRLIRAVFCAVVVAIAFAATEARAECLGAAAGPTGFEREYKSTGVPALDTAFNTEANHLHRLFGVTPNLMIIDDWGPKGNAYASPEITLAGYDDGTVRFGIQMLRDTLWNHRQGPIGVAGILAHEFAHVYQFAQRSRLLNVPGKYSELQADYLAGYYMGRRGGLTDDQMRRFFTTFYDVGDNNFWAPDHHGTPVERWNASVEGFRNAHLPLYQAYTASERYVLSQ